MPIEAYTTPPLAAHWSPYPSLKPGAINRNKSSIHFVGDDGKGSGKAKGKAKARCVGKSKEKVREKWKGKDREERRFAKIADLLVYVFIPGGTTVIDEPNLIRFALPLLVSPFVIRLSTRIDMLSNKRIPIYDTGGGVDWDEMRFSGILAINKVK